MSGKEIFIFSTAGFPAGKFLFHRALKTKLREKGCSIAGEFSCRGFDTCKTFGMFGGMSKEHPDHNDLDRAQAFAKKMAGL
jgi:flavodoxin